MSNLQHITLWHFQGTTFPVWPDLAKFSYFGNILNLLFALGQLYIVKMGQILKIKLAIRLHWTLPASFHYLQRDKRIAYSVSVSVSCADGIIGISDVIGIDEDEVEIGRFRGQNFGKLKWQKTVEDHSNAV